MKKTYLYGLLLIVAAIVSCTAGDSAGSRALSPEQQRLERINRIDSTSLSEVLNLDSIEGSELLSTLTADAWMLIDDSTGCIISEKNANEIRPMDTIEISEDVYIAKDTRVKLGDKYVMRHLIDEMMLLSDNDAAYALAKHVGGDTLSFCDMMNEKAAYLGMVNTHFANPNGLPNLNNYSTANDLVRLARYCMRDSLFAAIVGTVEKDIPLVDGRHLPCRNTNVLLSTYEGCLGIKTGFTNQAGNCLASAATRHGVTLYLVLLNSRSMSSRFKESAILLDYGFNVMKAYRKSS